MSGYFFVFDGMDGAGKSTALNHVYEALCDAGHDVVKTREPGGSPLAEDIRACMLKDRSDVMPVESELLLVYAARAAHLQQTVVPALNRGAIVLCDRFIDSSYVYQGVLGGCDPAFIDSLTRHCVVRGPDLTLLFDLPIDVASQRIAKRGADNRFDRVDRAQLQLIREGFQARAKACPERYASIDATQSPNAVCDRVISLIHGRLQ